MPKSYTVAFTVNLSLTNPVLRLDAAAVPLLLIVTTESEVERCVINRLFQKTTLLWLKQPTLTAPQYHKRGQISSAFP